MTGDARQLVKEGKVTAINAETHMVRVEFEDKDGMTSDEMPVLTTCAFGNKFYAMPDVGDMVVCLFASNSDMTGNGWIIGSRFNDKSTPNAKSADVMRMDFKDGTFVEYNRESHEMKIRCEGKVFVEAKKDISVKGEEKIIVEAAKDISIKGEAKISVEAEEDISVKTEGKLTIEASEDITLKSDEDIVFDAGGEIKFTGEGGYSLEAVGIVNIKGEKVLLNTED